MADELLEERIISNRGVLRVPDGEGKYRRYTLLCDVIRDPVRPFISNKWSPSRQRYGTLVFLRDEYVVAESPVDYEHRRYDWILDASGQTLVAVKCAYEGILETFFNLGNALSLPSISITNLIEDFETYNLLWNEVRLVTEPGAAFLLRLYGNEYQRCNDEALDEDKPPPNPPPIPKVPPLTPIEDISEPYPDDDVTDPEDIDSFPEPPPPVPEGTPCQTYTMNVGYQFAFSPFSTGSFNTTIRAPYFSGSLTITGEFRNQMTFEFSSGGANPEQCAANVQVIQIRSVSAGSPPRDIYADAWINSIT